MAKRYFNLYPQITAFDNLYRAFKKAAKGKRGQPSVAEFEFHLERNLFVLQKELETQTYRHGAYASFYIRDPKLRLISAAPFRDRVAGNRRLEPLFNRCTIPPIA
ncbi:MAG: hypothetical protein GY803_31120 [Chloroflexi bacterium]|nr:hypothetical protein [Chloroflexota bacterium]